MRSCIDYQTTLSGIPSSKLFFQDSLGITIKQKNYHMSLGGVYMYRRIIQKKFERYATVYQSTERLRLKFPVTFSINELLFHFWQHHFSSFTVGILEI